MKIRISLGDINQSFEGRDEADLLRQAKTEAGRRAPFLMRPVINNMGDVAFAAEVVKRVNQAEKRNDALPQSAKEFLDWAVRRGYAKVESA
jgi:hypothetical protein